MSPIARHARGVVADDVAKGGASEKSWPTLTVSGGVTYSCEPCCDDVACSHGLKEDTVPVRFSGASNLHAPITKG